MTLDSASRPPLRALGWLMARDANLTFGGGSATTEVLRRALVRRGWMSNEAHALLYGVSRLTPGTNLLAYCTAVGWLTRGSPGAVVALLAASLPASVIALVVTVMYERLAASAVLAPLLTLAMAVALFFLFSSAWQLARPYCTRAAAFRTIVTTGVVLALVAAGVAPIHILLVSAGVGAMMARTS